MKSKNFFRKTSIVSFGLEITCMELLKIRNWVLIVIVPRDWLLRVCRCFFLKMPTLSFDFEITYLELRKYQKLWFDCKNLRGFTSESLQVDFHDPQCHHYPVTSKLQFCGYWCTKNSTLTIKTFQDWLLECKLLFFQKFQHTLTLKLLILGLF